MHSGSSPLLGDERRVERATGSVRRVTAALACVLAAAALVLLAQTREDGRSALLNRLFYARFPRAPTTQLLRWDGCGAGGDCGSRYHWTAHSFSPVQGRQIDMQFTHDHASLANWWNRSAFEMGLPGPRAYGEGYWVRGAHREYNVSDGMYGHGGASKNLVPSYNELPPFNASWEPELIDPLEYWAQYFPIEKGYSANLYGAPPEEEEEEEPEPEAEEEEEAEAPPKPPPLHLFGRGNQMIFFEPFQPATHLAEVVVEA